MPHTVDFVLSCDRGVELLATVVLRGIVEDIMLDLLSDYPAPQFFDAQGEAASPFQVRNLGAYTFENRITLYGRFPRH